MQLHKTYNYMAYHLYDFSYGLSIDCCLYRFCDRISIKVIQAYQASRALSQIESSLLALVILQALHFTQVEQTIVAFVFLQSYMVLYAYLNLHSYFTTLVLKNSFRASIDFEAWKTLLASYDMLTSTKTTDSDYFY
jgi:hypothetical protein